MTQRQQQKAAKEFAEFWQSKEGYEKGQSQLFGLRFSIGCLELSILGFSTKMSESECVAKLFEMYQKLTN